jgi:hypothetical protein
LDSGANEELSGWRRFVAGLPMRVALLAVGTVWLLGCAWSFQEQSELAGAKGFAFPHLLPLVIDGFAVAMAGVSWAASLDARPAVPARLATLVAVAGSGASNGTWAWIRTGAGGAGHDRVAVVLGVAVPVAANLAFEVLLAELRRQVQRRRGLPAPIAIPYPRLVRVVLAPWSTVREWRRLVLEITDLAPVRALSEPAPPAAPAGSAVAVPPAAPEVPVQAVGAARVERPAMVPDAAAAVPACRELDTAPIPVQPHRCAPGVQALTLLTSRDGDDAGPEGGSAAAGEAPDERVALLVELLRQGQSLTGVAAAAAVGCSPRTGRRLLSEARDLTKVPA